MTPQKLPAKLPQSSDPEWIAGRVQTLLAHYFEPSRDAALTRAMLADWIEDLQTIPQWAIDDACRTYRRDQPRRRPTPGDIRNRALSAVGERRSRERANAPVRELAEPRPPRVTAEQATAIMAEMGFTPQRLAAVASGESNLPALSREPSGVRPRPETVAAAKRLAEMLGRT